MLQGMEHGHPTLSKQEIKFLYKNVACTTEYFKMPKLHICFPFFLQETINQLMNDVNLKKKMLYTALLTRSRGQIKIIRFLSDYLHHHLLGNQ